MGFKIDIVLRKTRYMMTKVLNRLLMVGALVFGLAVPALAQTPIEAGKSYTVSGSHDGTNVTGYRVYVDGVQAGADLPASASVAGVVTSPTLPGLTVGTHTLHISAFNAIGEVKSAPLSVSAQTLPTAPTNLKITITLSVASDGKATITSTTAETIK